MKKVFLFLVILFSITISITLISAGFGVDDPNLPKLSKGIDIIGGDNGGGGGVIDPGDIDHDDLSNLAWSVAGHVFDIDIDLGSYDLTATVLTAITGMFDTLETEYLSILDNSVNRVGADIVQAGTGDVGFLFSFSGPMNPKFTLGIDNTDDKFKISRGTTLGTTDVFTIDFTTGNIEIANDLDVIGDLGVDDITADIITANYIGITVDADIEGALKLSNNLATLTYGNAGATDQLSLIGRGTATNTFLWTNAAASNNMTMQLSAGAASWATGGNLSFAAQDLLNFTSTNENITFTANTAGKSITFDTPTTNITGDANIGGFANALNLNITKTAYIENITITSNEINSSSANTTVVSLFPNRAGDATFIGAFQRGIGVEFFKNADAYFGHGDVRNENPSLVFYGATSLGQKYGTIGIDDFRRMVFGGTADNGAYFTQGISSETEMTFKGNAYGFLNPNEQTVDHMTFGGGAVGATISSVWVMTNYAQKATNFNVPNDVVQLWLTDGSATVTNRMELYHDGTDGIISVASGDIKLINNTIIDGDLNVTGILNNPAIYCESSELNDQTFAVAGEFYRLNISNNDEGNGITMETGANNGTNISIVTSGVYHLVAQPQVKAGAGDAGDFHMWIEKFSSGTWANIADSNIELKLSSLEEDVIVLATTLRFNQGEKIRLVVSVTDNGILLHAQSPANEPVIPSIIFTMYRVGS